MRFDRGVPASFTGTSGALTGAEVTPQKGFVAHYNGLGTGVFTFDQLDQRELVDTLELLGDDHPLGFGTVLASNHLGKLRV